MVPLARNTEDNWTYRPKTLELAGVYFFSSDFSLSRIYADSAIADIQQKIKELGNTEQFFAALGYAYAFKGDKEKAIDYAMKATQLMPVGSNALSGPYYELDLAKVYIYTGEYELAMDKIEYLLTIPAPLSVPLLKIDPTYDKLRSLPRFQKILATEYKTNYK